MKIRLRVDVLNAVPGLLREVSGVERVTGGWEVSEPMIGRTIRFDAAHWEEVPEKHWRDVTAACEFVPENGLPTSRKLFYGTHAQTCIGDVDKGYRLRKIERKDWGTYPPVAFIVEKSE